MTRTHRTRFFIISSLLFLASSKASAQTPPASEDVRARARTVAGQGDAEFSAGRCDRAIRLWKEADTIFTAPTIELRIAHCQALIGHVVEASTTLESIVAAKLAPDAPEAFVAARGQAQTELPALKARIATVTIETRDMRGAAIDELLIDDEPMPHGKSTFSIDPGKHRIRMRWGSESTEKSIELGDGEKRTIVTSTILEQPPPPPKPARTAAYVVGGAGLALAAVGGVLGVMALGKSSDLKDVCGADRKSCPPDQSSNISSLKTKALLSDIFIGTGVVALGVGGFLFWRSTRVEKPPARVRLTITGKAALLEGQF